MRKEEYETTHRTSIPGLLGGSDFCTACGNHCGGDLGKCDCCGGSAEAREKARAKLGEAPAAQQSGAPVPGGTQVSPATGPGRSTPAPGIDGQAPAAAGEAS